MNASQQSVNASCPVLDIDALHDRCLGRTDLVERVLADFQDFLRAQLQELEAAHAAGDLLMTKSIAHRLKGASLTVSALRLSGCAHQLEVHSVAECAGQLRERLDELRTECDRLNLAEKSLNARK